MRRERLLIILAALWVNVLRGESEELPLPLSPRENVVGNLRSTIVGRDDSLLDIARAFDIGHDQIILANPRLNRWVPPIGATVLIPSLYVLPPGERRGIVLNLAELRLYFFPPRTGVVHTFPVSIGDYDWETPQGSTTVIAKQIDPPWFPPKSIRREHAEEGEDLPTMIPGGDPDNPLGAFALKLAIPGYLIHGTDQRRSFGIGMRVSHGCIRLYPEDIEQLYPMVPVGTPVRIIDQPVKAGIRDGQLLLEVHRALSEDGGSSLDQPGLEEVLQHLRPYAEEGIEIDTEVVTATLDRGDGVPTPVSSQGAAEERFWSDPDF
jgi:L,D-transpeptidase ErfK/SrfK